MHSSINKAILFLSFVILSCAVQAPPSGGPVDRIPPEIIATDPLQGTLHVPRSLNRLKIIFSERMKESSIRNNLFISPPVKFKTEWKKGRILLFELQESLKPQQTYVLSIGSALQDMHNNKMAHSFALAFSTGDTIDQGKIAGRIYGLKRNETFYVFAYLLNDTIAFNPFENKPDYVTLNGENGVYSLGFLKEGAYRVIAVEDRNHNLILDGIMERFALSFRDVILHDSLNQFSGLDMQLAKLDTIAPMLTGARARFHDLLVVRFSEPPVLDSLSQISVVDSLNRQPLPIKAWGKSSENGSWLEMVTAPMDSNRVYRLQCLNIADSSGNRNRDTLISYFMGSARQDTAAFKLLHYLPKDSAKKVRPEASVIVQFNQPVNWQQVALAFRLLKDSNNVVSGHWQIKNLYQAAFVPQKPLQPDHVYQSVLNLKRIQSYFNKTSTDSLIRHVFFVISQKELGEISGTIQTDFDLKHPVILNVRSVSGKRFHLRQIVHNKRTFKFNYLPEGAYKLDGFYDLNENGKFDHGTIVPFRFCEPFKFMQDTIKVRKRWETGGVIFTLPQPMETLNDSL